MSAALTPPFDNGGYRWAVNTSDDRSGTLYIFTFLGFTYSSFTFLTRLYIKWHMLGLDDAAMLAAQVLTLKSIYRINIETDTELGGRCCSVFVDACVPVSGPGKVIRYFDRGAIFTDGFGT